MKHLINKYLFILVGFILTCNSVVYAQTQEWVITNIAGNGTTSFVEGGSALENGFQAPGPMDISNTGDVYFSVPSLIVSAVAGIYKIEKSTNKIVRLLDNTSAISGLAFDNSNGKIYFSRGNPAFEGEGGPAEEYIYILNPDLSIDTLAGFNGEDGLPESGVHARETPIGNAGGLKIDPSGEFLYYVGNLGYKNYIQKINLNTGITYRVLGVSEIGETVLDDVPDGTSKDGITIGIQLGIDWDSEGNLYFSTSSNRIKKLKPDGTIWHVAGTGEFGHSGDGGPAATANINRSNTGITISSSNVMYFVESNTHNIRKITLFPNSEEVEIITTICGTGAVEGAGDESADLDNGFYLPGIKTNINPLDIKWTTDGLFFTDIAKRIRRATNCKQPEFLSTSVSSQFICQGDSVKLSFEGSLNDGTVWNWYKDGCGTGDAFAYTKSIIVVANEASLYYVAGVGGCVTSKQCQEFKIEFNCREFFNTFTPNNDGINDFFDIPIVSNFPTNTLVIYNRWGQELETIENYDNESVVWKGTNGDGDPVDSGTYYFTLVSNGEVIVSGWIELIK